MTLAPSILPPMVTIPAGVFNGVAMDSFRLGQTPVTNAQYAAHVDRFSDARFVLLATASDTQVTSLVGRGRSPQYLLGDFAKRLPKRWDTRDPMISGTLTLFQLRKDMSPEGFDGPNQPVNVSWFHAFEYCVGNGFFLPSDDQWSYAAGVHERREHATSTGGLYAADGNTKLAHFGTRRTIDVDDPRYPDGPHGLRHMTGNVWEWTARNGSKKYPYGLRGGSWSNDVPEFLRASFRIDDIPCSRSDDIGFRVGASASQDS
jgi:formylglycine-generating enzyme required for sulfatase activity